MPELQLRLKELLDHHEVQLEKRAISWYSTNGALWGDIGYSGQDESCLRYLHLPDNLDDVHIDLNLSHPADDYQLENFGQAENISDLLSWIKDFGNQDNWFAEAEFICQSHHLAGMLKIPYEPNDLCLHVEFYDGKFYLSRLPDRRNLQRVTEARESPEAFRVMRTKQGIKLDSYLLSGSPNYGPNPAKPVHRGLSGRRVVFHGTVGDHKLLYSSAFKCLDNAGDLQNLDQATFTGSKTINGESSSSVYRKIWMDWWSLSILGKVNRTVVACLPEPVNGIVTKLEIVKLSDMFQRLRNSEVRPGRNSHFVPQEKACFSCLDEILSFIKSAMRGASDGDIFQLKHAKSNPGVVTLRKIYNPLILVVPATFKEWVLTNKAHTSL